MEFLAFISIRESQCEIDGQYKREELEAINKLVSCVFTKSNVGILTSPEMKQLSILARIFLFLIFGRHLRSGLGYFRLLLRLPVSANSAR